MSADALKLTVYAGERARTSGAFVADALADAFARHRIAVSVVLRGAAGFGIRQHVRTDRLLTLSEDLPLVTVAVDTRSRVEAVLRDVESLGFPGLVTLERAQIVRDGALAPADGGAEAAKVTVYLGRHERLHRRRASEAVVAVLHRHGMAGAMVLLGVDGTTGGVRRRARFFGANSGVPAMVVAVGDAGRAAAALREIGAAVDRPIATVERVRVCKRDGVLLSPPSEVPATDAAGLGLWQMLTVYTSEGARHGGAPLHVALLRQLRQAGAAGATALRGTWGFHGDHAPHGDRLHELRRRVPVATVVVDTPDAVRRWFEIVDELTASSGLVTAETVPAYRARAAGRHRGGLCLAERLAG